MGDPGFASGLIGAVVAIALDKVIVQISKVVLLEQNFKNLRQLLDSLGPVLKEIAGKEKRDQNSITPVVRSWLQNLHGWLQGADALIQECSTQHWNPRTRTNLYNRISDMTKSLMDLQQQASSVSLAVMLPQTALLADIAQDLKNLKEEVKQMTLAETTRFYLASETVNKNRIIFEIKNVVDRHPGDASASSSSVPDVGEAPLLQPVPEFIFGLDELIEKLEGLLLDDTTRSVGVWGKGGAGKTLLAQTANNSPVVQARFGNNVFWLTVGRNPNVQRLQSILCEQIGGGRPMFDSKEAGKTKLFNLLREKEALLILDDVWEPGLLQWFDIIREPRSKTLMTSRNREILARAVNTTEVRVDILSESNSWQLFCRHAFQGAENVPPELKKLAEEVAAECKGLPLALKVIGGAMAAKRKEEEWRWAVKELRNAAVISKEQEEDLFQRLKLSFDELESIDTRGQSPTGRAILQECFLYFAAFPEDADVEVDQLVKYWTGERLIGFQESDRHPEDDAYYILGVLIGRSLIELQQNWSHDRSAKSWNCKVHDILRDLALYILQGNTEVQQRESLFQPGKELTEFPREWIMNGNGILSARRLSLMDNKLEHITRFKSRAPSMNVLILKENRKLSIINGNFFQNFRNLRVLDLSFTGIKSLPGSISKLRFLVVLDLNHSSIEEVPASVTKLIGLEYMSFQNCNHIRSFPSRSISKLTNLQHLNLRGCGKIWGMQEPNPSWCVPKCVCWQTPEPSALERLSSLTRITKLWIGSPLDDTLPASMGNLVKLRLLSVYFEKLKSLPDELKSLVELRTLDLNTCSSLATLPAWLPDALVCIEELDLRGCRRLSQLPALDKLQCLKTLDLCMCASLRDLPYSFTRPGAFPVLQTLWLMLCTELATFPEVEAGAFPKLDFLSLNGCSKLRNVPQSLWTTLTSLRHLDLGMCAKLESIPDLPQQGAGGTAAAANLEELSVKETAISNFPLALATLPRLQKLNLKGCKPSVFNPELRDTLRTRHSVAVEGWPADP